MKKRNFDWLYVVGFPILCTVLVSITYFLLSFGRVAQGTYNYSVLKDVETKGFLTTNAYYLTISSTNAPAASLVHLKLIKQFNGLAVGTAFVLALASILIVWRLIFRLRAERVISDSSSETKNRDGKT